MKEYANPLILRTLYWNRRMSLKGIAKKYGKGYSTIQYWMRKNNIERRKFINYDISEEMLKKLYIEKKTGTTEISKMFGCCEETIRKKLIKIGVLRRSNSESKTKYPKKGFSGDLEETAYMLGLRTGDLYVRRNHGLVRVKASTTHRSLIDTIKEIFGKYGHVMITTYLNKGLKEWRIECDLNNSFGFLLEKIDRIPEWILQNEDCFYAFLAGYSDAEGSWNVFASGNDNKGIRFRFFIGSCDRIILEQIKARLNRNEINALLYIGCKKGTKLTYGRLEKDFYHLIVTRRDDVLFLANKLLSYSHHSEKVRKIRLILSSINKKWDEVKPEIFELRRQIRLEKCDFNANRYINTEEREQVH